MTVKDDMGNQRTLFTEGGRPVAFIEPYYHGLLGDRLFDSADPFLNRDGALVVWRHLRERCKEAGIILRTSDFIPAGERSDVMFPLYSINSYSTLHREMASRRDILWGSFYLCEPPLDVRAHPTIAYRDVDTVDRLYGRVYASGEPEAVSKLPGLSGMSSARHFSWPQARDTLIEDLWNRRGRKTLVMINSAHMPPPEPWELYSERVRALAYFGARGLIDLYGRLWDQYITPLGSRDYLRQLIRKSPACLVREFRARRAAGLIASVYRGSCEDKYATLSEYDFAVCYENASVDGFITEKLFDCLFVGTIPIYLGDPGIASRMPENCFIDRRRFGSYRALEEYLSSITERDRERYREAGRSFLESDAFAPFTKQRFADRFLADAIEDLRAYSQFFLSYEL